MSFLTQLLNLFSPNKITVVIKPYNINTNTDTQTHNQHDQSLKYTFNSGITIKNIMVNINKYKNPTRQVKACYINGFKVAENLSIKENMTIYVSF